mmetsp:Transcript_31416/g.83619  ORF Transcript_31416/g.83619 Transcript_31416/m.83619 type:complete len:479 (-) Transcript_31416:131-1567(-)|eukprot:CAMPEP_0194489820 /NCGR_PEP_ID=MMETSP0253-20130528/9237_1 /TAXON_ID=2966 /ORGANISM="Noctiluca scintillans" /LENGTH=478 /DNA_ID=CAMNT_0039330353 /DNA_START=106 /DNA_END=1542 /DNA_ORIENTATION=-
MSVWEPWADERGSPLEHGNATAVTVDRTKGQVFRERVGFLLMCLVGAYCTMRILIELKSVLEPFLWALVLVMAWKPVIDSLEFHLEKAVGFVCCGPLSKRSGGQGRASIPTEVDDPDNELQAMIDDSDTEVLPPGKGRDSAETINRRRPGRRVVRSTDDSDDDDFRARAGCRRAIARGLAVLIALGLTVGALSGFGFLILESARRMRTHWDVYQKGAQNISSQAVNLLGYVFQWLPESFKQRYEDVTADVLKTAQDLLYALLGDVVNNISSMLLGGMLTLLYTLFWLCSPMPMDSAIDVMFRRYIMFKTLACFGFGICVGLWLAFLSIDLASVFALTTFALNYVPEVGPFVAMVLPCPVILLDGRLERPVLTLIVALLGQLAIKFAFTNIIEVKLIESDKKLRMHPVMILLSVGIFGHLWGPTGMLISVPLMALLKISLLSDIVPASYRDPILLVLEGDRNAPLRHEPPVGQPRGPTE